MRVLVVDDNVVQADALTDYLRDHGYDADWAPCLVGAVGYMKLRKYDVAVLDLVVTCCSTEELIRGVTSRRDAPRIVAFTGLLPGDPHLDLLPPGTPIVYKPADLTEIIAEIERLSTTVPVQPVS
jgi:DNA-binding response OmpR family regulator